MSVVGFNPNSAALQQMQLVSTLNSVAQNIATGNIEGALQQLVSLYSNMANDPVASGMMGGMGGIQPNFGNYARPALPYQAPRPPQSQLPQWGRGGGLQVPNQLLGQLQGGLKDLLQGVAQAPGEGVGHLDMQDVSKTLEGLDLANLMEGRTVTSGEHKGWSYGKINNEQELKDIIYNGIYEAQAGDGKLTDDELLAVIDEAISRATTEGVVEELTPKEQEAFKAELLKALDPLTADNLAAGGTTPAGNTRPTGPTGPIPTPDDLEVDGNKITTPGGYEVELIDRGNHYDVMITDPDGNKSYHWGDPHVSESDDSGAKAGETDYFWPDKNLSINLPDGSKISMHATGPKGVIENVEVYAGDKFASASAKDDKVELHQSGGIEFDAKTADGTRAFVGPGGDISDLFMQNANGAWVNMNPNEKEQFDSLSDFFQLQTPSGQDLKLDPDLKQLLDTGAKPADVQKMQMRRNLQRLLTFMQNSTGGVAGLPTYAGAATKGLAGAGLNLQNPAVQNFGQQLIQQQAGFGNPATQFPSYATPQMGFGGATGAGAGVAAPTGGATTAEQAWQNALSSYQQGTSANQSKYDQLLAMGVDPGQVAMMQMQEEMQRQNQLVSMLTNLMKMQHDTMKAVIQNLRV